MNFFRIGVKNEPTSTSKIPARTGGQMIPAGSRKLAQIGGWEKLGSVTRSPQPPAVRAFRKVVLLLDVSPSMEDRNKFPFAREGAMRFATAALKKGYHSGLVVFAEEASLITAPTGNLRDFERRLHSTAAGMLGGGTNIAQALFGALQTPEISAVVLVTDGQPTCPVEEAFYYADELRKRGIDIITIGTEDADRGFLARIATRADLAVAVNTSGIQNAISDASRLLAC